MTFLPASRKLPWFPDNYRPGLRLSGREISDDTVSAYDLFGQGFTFHVLNVNDQSFLPNAVGIGFRMSPWYQLRAQLVLRG
jgi:hypothetical protein